MKRNDFATDSGNLLKIVLITLPFTMLAVVKGQADFGIVSRRGGLIEGTVEGPVRVLAEDATLTLRENAKISGNLVLPRAKVLTDAEGKRLERSTKPQEEVSARFNLSNLAGASAVRGVQRAETDFGLPAVEPIVVPIDAVDTHLALASDVDAQRAPRGPLAPGSYGNLTIAPGGSVKLGNPDGTLAKYFVRSLAVGKSATVDVIGPVCIAVLNSAKLDGRVGTKGSPYWLELRVFAGEVAIASNSEIHAFVSAPSSHVSVGAQALCVGAIVADQVTLGKGSTLLAVQPRTLGAERDGTGPLFAHKALRAQNYFAQFQESLPEHLQAALTYSNELPLLVISQRMRPVHRHAQQEEALSFVLAAQSVLDGTGFESARIEFYRRGTESSPSGEVLRVSLSKQQYMESLWAISRIADPKDALRRVREDSLLVNLFMERCCKVASASWVAR